MSTNIHDKNDVNKTWVHLGGKFRRKGPGSCSEDELIAIIWNFGSRGRTAEEIARDVFDRYGNLMDLMGVPLKELMEIKGLKAVKATQLAAVFEVARRIVKHLERM